MFVRPLRPALAALGLLIAAGAATARADAYPPRALVAEAMKRFEVPGLAYAVVAGPAVKRIAVFGLRNAETGERVTRRTQFALGSISKSFTVALLHQLARDGRLDWDAPATRSLPGLVLQRYRRARPVTVRDLVSHRTGLPRHDALWYMEAYSADQLTARMAYLVPFAAPGKAFEYSNLQLMLAGRAASRLGGSGWAAMVTERLARPLGMTRLRIGHQAFRAEPDRAQGYYPADEGRIPIPVRNTDPVAPAAALHADIQDAAIWLAALAGRGQTGGIRILPKRAVEDMWRARTISHGPARAPELGEARYGMGFYITRYRGQKLVYHPGVIDGYAALIAVLPNSAYGIIVLTNLSGSNPAPAVLAYAAIDRHLGLRPVDWMSRFPSSIQRRASRARAKARRDLETARQRGIHAARSPKRARDYAGEYENPAYGTIVLSPGHDNRLAGRLHDLRFELEPWGALQWRLTDTVWPLREGLVFDFALSEEKKIRGFSAPIADGPTYRHNPGPLWFVRIP